MRIIGCDLHAHQQAIAMLDTTTREMATLTLMHEGNQVWEFYAQLPRPVLVGLEATGSMHWFLDLLKELGIDRRGAQLLMTHPGVGPVSALATDVFLGDPQRFADGNALASSVGVIPGNVPAGDASGSAK